MSSLSYPFNKFENALDLLAVQGDNTNMFLIDATFDESFCGLVYKGCLHFVLNQISDSRVLRGNCVRIYEDSFAADYIHLDRYGGFAVDIRTSDPSAVVTSTEPSHCPVGEANVRPEGWGNEQ